MLVHLFLKLTFFVRGPILWLYGPLDLAHMSDLCVFGFMSFHFVIVMLSLYVGECLQREEKPCVRESSWLSDYHCHLFVFSCLYDLQITTIIIFCGRKSCGNQVKKL